MERSVSLKEFNAYISQEDRARQALKRTTWGSTRFSQEAEAGLRESLSQSLLGGFLQERQGRADELA